MRHFGVTSQYPAGTWKRSSGMAPTIAQRIGLGGLGEEGLEMVLDDEAKRERRFAGV